MLTKKLYKIFFLIPLFLFIPLISKAVCPVCTIAIASGVGLCRYLGIDDIISGLWIGGLLLSITIWFKEKYLQKRNKDFKYSSLIILFVLFLLTFIPLKFTNILGHKYNKVFGIDRLVFSSLIGIILLYISIFTNSWLKKRNNNKVYFPYQKVVIPILFLTIFSFIFYFIFC